MKIFPGASPEAVTADYKDWLASNPGVVIIGKPTIQEAGTGWILTVTFQPPPSK